MMKVKPQKRVKINYVLTQLKSYKYTHKKYTEP